MEINHKQYSFLQWNLCSYRTKFSDLKLILAEHNPVCVCLQETMLGGSMARPPSGYKIVQSTPPEHADGHERGVAILVDQRHHFERVQLRTSLQAVCIKLFLDKAYTVCSLYLPHVRITKRDLDSLLSELRPPYLVLGDMNAKSPLWGNATTDERGRMFEQLLLDNSIHLLNDNSPTHYHVQTNSYSVIDLSLCSADLIFDFSYRVLDSLHDSDHYPITLSLQTAERLERPERFLVAKAEWDLFHELTRVEPLMRFASIDARIDFVERSFYDAAILSMPLSCGPCRRPPVPWFNDECKMAHRTRLRAERALKRNRTAATLIAYNWAKAKARRTFNQSRKESWERYVSSITKRVSLHRIWKKVAKISGRFTPSPTPVLREVDGTLLTREEDVANRLVSAFASVSLDENYSEQFLRFKRQQEQQPMNFSGGGAAAYNDPFTSPEFRHALSLTSDSSPGSDMVTYSMIKHAHLSLQTFLLDTFNLIFFQHEFPANWRTSIIVPLAKPGKDHTNPTNYRPIALTSCLCKLLEKMVNIRLMWYLERGGYITHVQSGFRRNRSTTDHLVQFEQDVQTAMHHRRHTLAVFFDLTKAYDTAWRYGVLRRLHTFGLRGHLPIFVSSFLRERRIRVRVGAKLSASVALNEGVGQGSVLSCTCFMVAMNDIVDTLPPSISATLYVDDLLLYCSGKIPESLERRMQLAINGLSKWSNETGFSFSAPKSVSMHICRVRGCTKLSVNLSLNNRSLRCVSEYKFLGVIIDNGLTWSPHIANLKRSCHKTLALMKHISHQRWGADRTSLLRLYIMLLKPKLDYGCEAFSSARESLLKTLGPVQHAAVRIATGAYRTSPIPSLHAECGLKPLEYYRQIKVLNFLARVYVVPSAPLHAQVFAEAGDEDVALPPKGFLSRAGALLDSYDVSFSRILQEIEPEYPPWRVTSISSCTALSSVVKSDHPTAVLKDLFCQHFLAHSESVCAFTDGSRTVNGVGYAFVAGNVEVSKRISDVATVFTAELLAIFDSLRHCLEASAQPVTICTDARSAIQALTGFNPRSPLVQMIRNLVYRSGRPVCLCWVPSHVGVHLNERADAAAKSAIDLPVVEEVPIPRSDFKCHIKSRVWHRWRQRWEEIMNNKYRKVTRSVVPFATFQNRRWNCILTRLRIGHCQMTHGYLLNQELPPYCDDCIVPLSVEHVLCECPSYADQRLLFFQQRYPTIAYVLGNTFCAPNGPLYNYLSAIDIIDKL